MIDKEGTLKDLQPYIQAKQTGTAMLVFSDDSLGRIYLRAGTMVSARYKGLEGMLALNEIRSTGTKTVKFYANTDIVLSTQSLDSNAEGGVKQPKEQKRPPKPVAPVTGEPLLTKQQRNTLGQILSEYIGPVAPLVMADLPVEVDLETALDIIAKEMDEPQQGKDFILSVRKSLK